MGAAAAGVAELPPEGTVLEKYRVLSAMVAQGQFTVDDLARVTGVRPATVQTVVRRHRACLQEVGSKPSGGRGRPHVEYRLRDEHVETLTAQLVQLDAQLDGVRARPAAPRSNGPRVGSAAVTRRRHRPRMPDGPPPAALVSARALLVDEIVAVDDAEERWHLLEMAELGLRSAIETLGLAGADCGRSAAGGEIALVRFLIVLSQAELLVDARASAGEITPALANVALSLQRLRETVAELPAAVERRLERSPVAASLSASLRTRDRPARPEVSVVPVGDGGVLMELTGAVRSVLSRLGQLPRVIPLAQLGPPDAVWRTAAQQGCGAAPVVFAVADDRGPDVGRATRAIERVAGNAPFVVLSDTYDDDLVSVTYRNRGQFLLWRTGRELDPATVGAVLAACRAPFQAPALASTTAMLIDSLRTRGMLGYGATADAS